MHQGDTVSHGDLELLDRRASSRAARGRSRRQRRGPCPRTPAPRRSGPPRRAPRTSSRARFPPRRSSPGWLGYPPRGSGEALGQPSGLVQTLREAPEALLFAGPAVASRVDDYQVRAQSTGSDQLPGESAGGAGAVLVERGLHNKRRLRQGYMAPRAHRKRHLWRRGRLHHRSRRRRTELRNPRGRLRHGRVRRVRRRRLLRLGNVRGSFSLRSFASVARAPAKPSPRHT